MSARRSACCEKKAAEKYFEIAANMAASKSMELSRQLDAHFGINGERPEPVGPEPASDRSVLSEGPEPRDSS